MKSTFFAKKKNLVRQFPLEIEETHIRKDFLLYDKAISLEIKTHFSKQKIAARVKDYFMYFLSMTIFYQHKIKNNFLQNF